METKKGIIKNIEIKTGVGKTGKPYKSFVFEMTDGMKYSTFDTEIFDQNFSAGDSVEMVGEQNGQYWNMKSMKKLDGEAPMEKIGYSGGEVSINFKVMCDNMQTVGEVLKLWEQIKQGEKR